MRPCTKKKFDKIGAMLALSECKYVGRKARPEKRYYRCAICRAYHLTSKKQTRFMGLMAFAKKVGKLRSVDSSCFYPNGLLARIKITEANK